MMIPLCPVNLDMEMLMGVTDYRLQKVRTLVAASRGIILGKTQELRETNQAISFRAFRKEVEAKRFGAQLESEAKGEICRSG